MTVSQPGHDTDEVAPCACTHSLLLHDGGEECTLAGCACTWFHEVRPDFAAPSGPANRCALAEFLLARIAEDEAVAREGGQWDGGMEIAWRDVGGINESLIIGTDRVLAECEAKRRLIDLTIPHVLRILALLYANHPDYREEWRL